MDLERFGALRFSAGIAYRITGSGPMLVLVHGGTGSRLHWARTVAALRARFRIVTIDLPGYGESSTPAPGVSPDDYLQWVADSLQPVCGNDPYHLVGFSFGGAVAAAVAAEMSRRQRPPLRLSLISPAGWGRPVGRNVTLEKVPRGPGADPAEVRATTARNLGRWMLTQAPAPDDEVIDMHLYNVAHARYDSRKVSFRETLLADLKQVPAALQVMLGAKDPLIWPSPAARATAVADALPAARLLVVDDGGHWLQHEASAIVHEALVRFHLPGDFDVL